MRALVFSLLAGFATVIWYDPVQAQTCSASGTWELTEDEHGTPSYKMHVYIESDMNVELRNFSTVTSDDNLTYDQVRNAVMAGAEVWNNETSAMKFVYAGAVAADSVEEFCAQTTQRPAVFVNFQSSYGGDAQVLSATCANARRLRFGTGWDLNGTNGKTWGIGSQTITPNPGDGWYDGWFTNVVIHELGHVVGLGDIGNGAGEAPCSTHGTAKSVMNKCTPKEGTRHPLSWDKDCAATFNPGPKLGYRRRGYSAAGAPVGLVQVDYRWSYRDGVSLGYSLTGTGTPYYSFYYHDATRSAYAGDTDGYLYFYDWYMDAAHIYDLYRLDALPALFRPVEYAASAEGMRVSFVDDENDATPTIKYNPPYAQFVRTDALFGVSPSADDSWERCTSTACTGWQTILTHLPVVGVEDPVSGDTVHVWVETRSDDKEDGRGWIWVSSGIHSTSQPQRVRVPEKLSDNTTFQNVGGAWNPTGRTDVPPAVACADAQWNAPSGGYNCILAWTDKGHAVSNGAAIMYKFFKVGVNGGIDWAPGVAYYRSSSDTANGPALGFFADKIWMAWKDIGSAPPTIKVSNASAANYTWTVVETLPAEYAVGVPSFGARNGREGVLVWGESW